MAEIQDLHDLINKAGIPIDGVNSERVISFKEDATAEQQAQAQAIADSFDFGKLSEDEKLKISLSDVVTPTFLAAQALFAAGLNDPAQFPITAEIKQAYFEGCLAIQAAWNAK